MFAARQIEEAEDDGFVDLPADLMSELEHCLADGIRTGAWPPCSIQDFVIHVLRAGRPTPT